MRPRAGVPRGVAPATSATPGTCPPREGCTARPSGSRSRPPAGPRPAGAALTGERATEPRPEADEIETDRDSFTPATSTAGRGRLITEAAYSSIDDRGVKETHSLPEFLLRYGLTDRVEPRLGWNYEVGGAGNEVTGVGAADEDPVRSRARLVREYTLAYGGKVLASAQAGWVPRSSLIVQGFTPTGGSAGATTATQLVATYAAGWRLPNRWKLDGAVRYGTAGEAGDRFNLWAPSAAVRVPVGESWAAHAEYFGLVTTGPGGELDPALPQPRAALPVTPDPEVGFRLGWGLNDQSARFFSNVGLGCRF